MAAVSIHPYYEVEEGKMDEFKAIWAEIIPVVQAEEKCLCYHFSFNGNVAYCRQAYTDAEGALTHMKNVEASIGKSMAISKVVRLEVHGPAAELAKLRETMGAYHAQFFEITMGFWR